MVGCAAGVGREGRSTRHSHHRVRDIAAIAQRRDSLSRGARVFAGSLMPHGCGA
eukprot:gene43247-311_t